MHAVSKRLLKDFLRISCQQMKLRFAVYRRFGPRISNSLFKSSRWIYTSIYKYFLTTE